MGLPLFGHSLRFAVLGSGSSGNCTYIGDGHSGVLIDCGLSTRQILARMAAVGLEGAPIDAVLITHEHSDHVGAAAVLSRRLTKSGGKRVPFFLTGGTRESLRPETTPDGAEIVPANVAFSIGRLLVEPFSVPHDTLDPVAWRVCVEGRWAGVITDLGRGTALVAEKLRSLSAGVLEFNHDLDLLMEGPYPWSLKQRIRSSHGHLSNEQAAGLLRDGLGPELRHLVLGHLSKENNAPGRARAAADALLAELGAEIEVHVASQDQPLRLPDLPLA